jgi:exosortase D (VPLPA-CTERM-specific)
LKELTQIKPVGWIKFAIYGLLFLGIYYSAFTWLITKDWEREAYSYCWLIPPLVLFLIWLKRSDLTSRPSEASWAGLLPMVMGIFFFWLGELSGEFFTLYISSWLVLVGICFLHLGWQKLKLIGFALFFILTLFPIPHFINTRLMLQLRLISSKWGTAIIHLFGIPAARQGNIIDLGFTRLQVVDACSGLHSLLSLIVLCLLLAYFFKDHIWKRLVLLVSSIPLAIVTNSMRIAVTAILYKYFGAGVAQEFFHGFSGVLIFVICIPVLLIEIKILEKLPPVRSMSAFESKETEGIQATANKKVSGFGSLCQPVFIVAVILLGTTMAFSNIIDFRERIPIKKNLDQFPLKIGEWDADRRQPLAKYYIDALDLSEYVIIDYRNPKGKEVSIYVAYYESQSKGESIHSPATCLPGSGWCFNQSGTVKIAGMTGHNGTIEVNRAVMQLGQHKRLSYYWFPQRGRILTNAYQLKIFTFWDALTRQRTDGALVRLITPVYPNEKIEAAEARLKKFVTDIEPVLEEYLPGKDLL